MLAIPAFHYLLEYSNLHAIVASLVLVFSVSLLHSIINIRHKQINWELVLIMGTSGASGAWLGSQLAQSTAAHWPLVAFSVCAFVASFLMFKPISQGSGFAPSLPVKLLVGSGMGLITGFAGVGGGFLLVPVLIRFSGLDYQKALGTSLFIICLQSSVALSAYLAETMLHNLNWQWTLSISAIAALGSLAGKNVLKTLNKHTLNQLFATGLMLVAAGTLWQQLTMEIL